jgi:hypothetical protein
MYIASIRDTVKIHTPLHFAGPAGAIGFAVSSRQCLVEDRGDHFVFYTARIGTYFIYFTSRSTGSEARDTVKIEVTDQPPRVTVGKKRVLADLNKDFSFSLDITDDGADVTVMVDFNGDGKPDTACFGKGDPGFRFCRPTRTGETKKILKAAILVMDNDSHRVYDSAMVCIRFHPPVAEAGSNIIVCPDEAVTLSGKRCKDNNGYVKKFIWDFNGDGAIDTVLPLPQATWTFEEVKDYRTLLWVEDNEGNRSRPDTLFVTVMRDKPTASAGLPVEAKVGESVSFFGQGSSICSQIEKYLWDFENDGKWDYISRGHGRTTYTYRAPGSFFALFTVVDSKNDSASQVREVKVIR